MPDLPSALLWVSSGFACGFAGAKAIPHLTLDIRMRVNLASRRPADERALSTPQHGSVSQASARRRGWPRP
jgi:hypothetical protein